MPVVLHERHCVKKQRKLAYWVGDELKDLNKYEVAIPSIQLIERLSLMGENAYATIAQKVRFRLMKIPDLKHTNNGLVDFGQFVGWILKKTKTSSISSYKCTVDEWRPYFMPDVARSYLLRNFDDLVKGEEINRRAREKARAMLIMVAKAWSLDTESIPSIKLEQNEIVFGRRIRKLGKAAATLPDDDINMKVYNEIVMGNELRIHAKAKNVDPNRPVKFLDDMRLELDSLSFPDTFMSKDHFIQDSLMAAAIFGETTAPENVTCFEWPGVLPFCPREVVFDDTSIHPFYVAAEVANNLLHETGEICRRAREELLDSNT